MPVPIMFQCCPYHQGPYGRPAPRITGGMGGEFRQGFEPMPATVHGLVDALYDAVDHDHHCEDPGCDIAAALAHSFTTAAYWGLEGATEAHACDALLTAARYRWGDDAVAERVGTDLYNCPDWEGWKAHHDTYGRSCESCGGFTYAESDWEPDDCAQCGARLRTNPFAESDSRPETGSYQLIALMDDGESLCESCLSDPDNPVHDQRGREPGLGDRDGWGVVAFYHSGDVDTEGVDCSHCYRTIVEPYREGLSSNHFSTDCQLADVVRAMPGDVRTVFDVKFPEWDSLTWSGAWVDVAASGVDEEYTSWAIEWVESHTNVMWDDGEPYVYGTAIELTD